MTNKLANEHIENIHVRCVLDGFISPEISGANDLDIFVSSTFSQALVQCIPKGKQMGINKQYLREINIVEAFGNE